MGCDTYYSDDTPIRFLEMDDSAGCLCTFPHNDGGTLDAERVRSLAYLGAAVVLLRRKEIAHGYIPACLPEWVRREIDSKLGLKP